MLNVVMLLFGDEGASDKYVILNLVQDDIDGLRRVL